MADQGSGTLIDLPGTAPVGLADRQVEIHGLLLGTGTDYIITGWEGFGTPEVRTTDEARSQEDGDWLGTDTLGSRLMTLTMTIRGTGAAGVTENYNALLRAWSLSPGANYTNLWFSLPGHPVLRAIGRPRRVSANKNQLISGRIDCVAEFYSPFSPLYEENETLLATGQIIDGGGRTYPFTYPKEYVLDVSGGETVFADNSGTYPAWGVLTCTGGVVASPRVYNQDSDQFIGFDVSMGAADELIIDMRLRTAKLNGTSVRHKMLAGSTWWNFPVGEATALQYRPVTYDADAQCLVTFAPAHKG